MSQMKITATMDEGTYTLCERLCVAHGFSLEHALQLFTGCLAIIAHGDLEDNENAYLAGIVKSFLFYACTDVHYAPDFMSWVLRSRTFLWDLKNGDEEKRKELYEVYSKDQSIIEHDSYEKAMQRLDTYLKNL